MDKGNVNAPSSEKIVKIHNIIIFCVCIILGIVNIVTGSFLAGGIVLAMGIILPLIVILGKSLPVKAKATILSVGQTIVILTVSAFKGEIQAMFPLLVASFAISATYYNRNILRTLWVVTDAAAVAAVFFMGTFYKNTSITHIAMGIIGVNIAFVLIDFLVKWSLSFINEAKNNADESSKLVKVVEQKMAEAAEASKNQTSAFNRVSEIASLVNNSSAKMLDVANHLSNGSSEQSSVIEELSTEIILINNEIKQTLASSEEAVRLADQSRAALEESNRDMKEMLEAMGKIAASSNEIGQIIKTIDDIAFQTNILALNAAIEAARAGAAGKGFGIVADEVRNLAAKSADAAKSSARLIGKSLSIVDEGSQIADKAANAINAVIEISDDTVKQTKSITEYAQNQADSVMRVSDHMQQILEVVNDNAVTAEESSQVAQDVSNDVAKIYSIVKK